MQHWTRMARISAAAVVVAVSAMAASSLAAPQAPVRDRAPAVRTGTGAIRGRVLDGVSGAPIARARVRLQIGGTPRPFAMTDADGVFAFTRLPPGPFSIMVEKSTYLSEPYPARGRTVRSMNRPASLADGETLDVVIRMYHGGAIAGRVVDAYGDPVEYAGVTAMRLIPGVRPENTGGGVQTNDLGEFRVPRLQPGTYVLRVSPRRMGGEELLPAVEQLQQPMPTYYPSAVSPDQAQPIALERGQAVTGLDVVLAEGTPTVVTGVVLRRDGEPLGRRVFISARPAGRAGMYDGAGVTVRPDGTFRMLLHPGEYILDAQVSPEGPVPPGVQESGMTRLSVGGTPAEAVTILVGPRARASGRVVFEGSTPAPPPLAGPLHVPLFSSEGSCQSGQARVAKDWTFQVEGLGGMCSAPPRLTFGRWTLKAVLKGGEDLLDRQMTFEPGQHLDGLQLVFTDRRTEALFRVSDESGQPTKDYVGLAFPTDKARWTNDAMSVVQVLFTPPPDMVYNMNIQGAPASMVSAVERQALALSPGDYYIIALDDIAHEDIRSPQVLERLATGATRITLAEGVQLEITLRRMEIAQVLR